jgi:hypothetical protein
MVFVFSGGKEKKSFPFLAAGIAGLVLVSFTLVFLFCVVDREFNEKALVVLGDDPPTVIEAQETGSWAADLAVREVAESYKVPVRLADGLIEYMAGQRFNEKYGGVGLFSVRPSHLGWIENSVLQGAIVDLEDPVQNAQVAMFLLSGFHRQGYSWESCALIYCFGFPAIHEREKYLDFINFLGEVPGE